jgi:stage IV sporulation protein B
MRLRNYRRFLIIVLFIGMIFTCAYSYKVIDDNIPDEINVFSIDDICIKTSIPISYKVTEESLEASANTNSNRSTYMVKTKIFGFIPAKEVTVNVIEDEKIIPCGIQIGIYLHTDGVMIIDTGEVTDINGVKSSPSENIIKADDYICSLNGIDVNSKSQLIFLINKYGANDIILGIKRNGNYLKVKVTPVCVKTDEYKIGIWVRDDSQGIGTLTYLTEDGKFGALGHGISDVDTGKLLSSIDGVLYKSEIWGIKKGENGNPGGLLGSISYESKNEYGIITGNTNHGIFGEANDKLLESCNYEMMEIGLKQEVEEGKAYIRCMISGKMKDYEIEISKVDYANNEKNKGMEIEIVDKELLELTNGIVQGMSGSPIIQNGKIIGAVTHVFVNDSKRGYGIFIENMLVDGN